MSSDCMFYPRELVRRCRRKQNDEIIKHILPSNKLSIFAGDLNDDHEFVSGFSKKLKYSLCNLEKLVTFEKTDMQLDYVLINRSDINVEYSVIETSKRGISDHNILVCDVK